MLRGEAGALPSTKSLKFNQTEISEGSAKIEPVISKCKVKIPSLNGNKNLHLLVCSLNVPRMCVCVCVCARVCVCVHDAAFLFFGNSYTELSEPRC